MIAHRLLLFIFFLLGTIGGSYAQRPGSLVLRQPGEGKASVEIEAAFLADPEGSYTLEQLLRSDAAARLRAPTDRLMDRRDYYVWLLLQLENPGQAGLDPLLSLNRDADSTWLYVVDAADRVVERRQWSAGQLGGSAFLTFHPNTYQIVVPPRSTYRIYVRAFYPLEWTERQLATTLVHEPRQRINRQLRSVGWHSLYTGLMLGLALFGIFGFGLFRDRVFLYYALVTLSFAAYFADSNLLPDLMGLEQGRTDGFGWMQFTISACVVSFTLFMVRYVELRRRLPRLYRLTVATGLLAVLAQYLPYALGWHVLTIIQTANLSLLLWMLACIVPVALLGYRGDALARRLLWATMALLVPGLLFIVPLIVIDDYYRWAEVCFQLGTVAFSALLFGGVYSQVSAVRQRAASLQDESDLRSRFFTNISHEFRTPLTLMIGPLEELMRRHPPQSEEHELLSVAHASARRQLRLINRVLELSRLEARQERLETETLDLIGIVHGVTRSFAKLAESRGVALHFTSPLPDLFLLADRGKVEDILMNLLSNALKFTTSGGAVTVSVHQEAGAAVVRVRDTGAGIPAGRLAGIFDRFVYSDAGRAAATPGSGIGLSLVRELVRLHGGRVFAESEVGQGTTLTFTLPIAEGVIAEKSTNVTPVPNHTDAPVAAPQLSVPSPPSDDAPLLLIVEDNASLRALLRLTLGQQYRVEEATDGATGITAARELQPALIISDVMMPGQDGFSLCRAIKSDVETSHIPVVLLTARDSTEGRLTGLGVGADDYLTKPYNNRELLARVGNLIESRHLLRQRYAASIELSPTEVATTAVDAEFLERATTIMEREMDNESYKVAGFAHDLGMSSASLNRKLRGLLDQSTNQFMQSVRLRRAADLLATGSHTVAEVALLTGFGSSAYFIRAFREKYGHTPGSVLRDA